MAKPWFDTPFTLVPSDSKSTKVPQPQYLGNLEHPSLATLAGSLDEPKSLPAQLSLYFLGMG